LPTLILLRHAKSGWDDPGLADHDRPLAPRGRKAAPLVGAWLREQGLAPDLVLCSTALRAVATWDLVAGRLGARVPVRAMRSLYLAPPSRILKFVHRAPPEVERLLVVGHNPGLESLAHRLVGGGAERDLSRLRTKFPTGAAAVIAFEVPWREVAPGQGRLLHFLRPKDL
jgi:phosphohistidine phosphatase